eukprot:c14644_g1_i1 orf=99-1547(+)
MKGQRVPLLIHGDEELAQIAAAFEIPEAPNFTESSPPWRSCLPHVCIASIGAFLFGYHSGVLNATLQFVAEDLGFVDNSLAQGWVVSICLVGGMLGCILSGTVADDLGRRRAAQLSTIPVIIGGCFSAVATSLKLMIVGRFLVGLGLGMGASATSLYITEISPAPLRGTFGALCQVAACLGLLAALVAGLPVAAIPRWWRVCFWISSIPAALLLLGLEFCSESPRWLFKQSRWFEAEAAIKKLWGASNLKAAIADLVQGDSKDKNEQATYAELFTKQYVKVILKGAAILAFQQFAGVNAVFYFSSTFFRNAGVTSNLAASVSVGFVNLFASCCAACLMDRLGRKTLLIWSFLGMALGMAIQSCALVVPIFDSVKTYVLLCGTLFYVFMFAVGVGPVPLALLPEMFSNHIRAKAMAISLSVLWITSWLVGLLYLPILNKYGNSFLFTFFALVSLSGAIFVRTHIVETKGRSLEEIEALLFGDL